MFGPMSQLGENRAGRVFLTFSSLLDVLQVLQPGSIILGTGFSWDMGAAPGEKSIPVLTAKAVRGRGAGQHAPLSALPRDLSSYLDKICRVALVVGCVAHGREWDLGPPPEQHCISGSLVFSADLIVLCCFSCPYLNQHYHY